MLNRHTPPRKQEAFNVGETNNDNQNHQVLLIVSQCKTRNAAVLLSVAFQSGSALFVSLFSCILHAAADERFWRYGRLDLVCGKHKNVSHTAK